MENEQASTKKIIIQYGVLFGIASVLLGVVLYVTNAYKDPHWSYSILSFLLIISVISLGIKAYKTANNGFLTLSDALKTGIGIALVGGIISVIWAFILTTVIEPEYMQQVLEIQKEKMIEDNPNFSQEQIDQSMAIAEKFTSPYITIAFSMIGSLFFGFIVSLFAGLIMQRKPED
ncbi:hypothetical protein GCM10022393_33090 [Aquimarina addita]|uniref:DUF4199 domain-containing protein n=1 Tax=Aquimarina addita TaxID=870485 RepID=A0ABP6US03_9FLAO